MFKAIIKFNRFIAGLFGIRPQVTDHYSVSDFTTEWVNDPAIKAWHARNGR